MTWGDALPVQLAAAALVLLPGLVLGWALRLRGALLPAAAPALTTAVLAAAGLLAPPLGFSYGWRVVAAGTVAASLVAALLGRVLLRGRRPAGPSSRGAGAAALAGTAVAAVLALASVRRGLGRPDAVSQSFDALFHLNALRWALDTGDVSPLHLTRMNSPEQGGYYPAAWHALAVLLAQVTGAAPVVAADVVVWVVAGLVWPLGCVLLARAVLGERPAVLFAAAVGSQGFVAMPWLLDRWGVLWPQSLGTALLPVLLGLLLLAGAPPGAGPGGAERLRLLLAALPVAVAAGSAHPGTVLLAVPLAVVLALVTLLPGALVAAPGPAARRLVLGATLLAAVGGAVVLAVLWPRTASIRAFDWPATRSVPRAVAEGLAGAPAGAGGSAVVAVLVLVGCVVAATRARWRWLPVAHLLLLVLDVLAAAVDDDLSRQLTGLWYNDRFRLASALPVTGLPLALLGASWLLSRLPRPARARPAAPLAAALLAVLVVVPQVRGNGDQLGLTNVRAERAVPQSFVSPDEQRFLAGLGRWVPPGDVVVGDPWDGSSFAYALGGVHVLYPHFLGRWPGDWFFLADNLQRLGTDPAVCEALARTRVRWVLDDGARFDPQALTPNGFTGLQDVAALPGVQPVASGGGATLYRITACG